MATAYKTPGVYIEEVSTLPASVAQVETAIPAFIGYTEKAPASMQAIEVNSIREYEELFGGPQQESYNVTITDISEGGPREIALKPSTDGDDHSKFKMYYGLKLFFQNGGGKCYVISVGDYSSPITKSDFEDGLGVLEKEDEPTLILFPDATSLTKAADGEEAGEGTGEQGAEGEAVEGEVSDLSVSDHDSYYEIVTGALTQAADLGDRFVLVDVIGENTDNLRNTTGKEDLMYGAAYYPNVRTNTTFEYDENEVTITHVVGTGSGDLPASLPELGESNSVLYNDIKAKLESFKVVLPPSPLVAGVYARIDGERGVWKAPANASLSGILGPTIRISTAEQGSLNIDPESGKSINAIRTFAGKGTLVWGARTLAGNDNEWRYISVRRFYNMVEESLKKSTSWTVFESNDANTWIMVKGMIQNYLLSLWKQGALAGGTPDQAFFVKIGLGETMTSIDVLEGRMNIEIGLATVRPAEFIILKFSHKLQE